MVVIFPKIPTFQNLEKKQIKKVAIYFDKKQPL